MNRNSGCGGIIQPKTRNLKPMPDKSEMFTDPGRTDLRSPGLDQPRIMLLPPF